MLTLLVRFFVFCGISFGFWLLKSWNELDALQILSQLKDLIWESNPSYYSKFSLPVELFYTLGYLGGARDLILILHKLDRRIPHSLYGLLLKNTLKIIVITRLLLVLFQYFLDGLSGMADSSVEQSTSLFKFIEIMLLRIILASQFLSFGYLHAKSHLWLLYVWTSGIQLGQIKDGRSMIIDCLLRVIMLSWDIFLYLPLSNWEFLSSNDIFFIILFIVILFSLFLYMIEFNTPSQAVENCLVNMDRIYYYKTSITIFLVCFLIFKHYPDPSGLIFYCPASDAVFRPYWLMGLLALYSSFKQPHVYHILDEYLDPFIWLLYFFTTLIGAAYSWGIFSTCFEMKALFYAIILYWYSKESVDNKELLILAFLSWPL
jgi:hypothetical protein